MADGDSEAGTNLLLNVLRRLGAVDIEHQFLAAKQVQHRFRFVMVFTQTIGQCLRRIILSRHQFAAADITSIFLGGSVRYQVVIQSTVAAEASR